MWPVFVVPYNLPPWACMDEPNLMMALLIPGPTSPGKDFDVFLEPLVEDLIMLWKGVPTYDAFSDKMFNLSAAVLWCIHDYPALRDIRLRRNNEYVGLHGTNDPPGKFSKQELLEVLEKVRHVRPGKPQGTNKRKRSDSGKSERVRIWSRRVFLWDLEYWKNLKLRHNLDVMHIEKNICENLISTILNIIGKTKDTMNARLDLSDLGIKEELQFKDDGDSSEMPHARYTLSKEQKIAFCNFLREVKFPDGYASNISRCVNVDGTKVQGLKTHDCHILLQRILPAAIRGFFDKDIYEAIADFFDVMVHLAVHLPEEALLRGPVQYGWMYPIERRLYTLKRYVRNRARPEGSIAEAYIADENVGFSDEEAYGVDIFGHGVTFTSAAEYVYDETEIDQMVWYVLNNSSQAEEYVKMFRDELERERVHNISRALRQGFQTWFRNQMMRQRYTNEEEVDDDLFSLACGPDFRVRKYKSCIVNGVRFNTVDRDVNKKTRNSGVMSQDYNGEERSAVLFKCDWFKLDGKMSQMKNDGYFKSINIGNLWYKNDSFILATQARKVFYLPDTKFGKNWQVVQTFDHRHLYNVSETNAVPFSGPAYQEDESCEEEGRQIVSDFTSEKPLNRNDERGPIFDATEIARLRNEKPNYVYESDSEDEGDDTLLEYCSEDEGGATIEVDSDDE
ncbi:transposase family TNP2 [Gossypium australe]|uniref:Transposase family TNP2 n=1 Tax=Gossypium australe TaxID=47621 RepID=A0A5B6U021_9ROSI|nr:transposase family TNP2 [Gossypium australe]